MNRKNFMYFCILCLFLLLNLDSLWDEKSFRESKLKSLSDSVQKRLYALQNPINCLNAKYLLCKINYPCGFGCQIHKIV